MCYPSELENRAKNRQRHPCTARRAYQHPFVVKAAGTRADHLSAFHRPDLYAESVDCRVGIGGVGLGASGDGVLIGVFERSLRASAYFSSCRRTCAVLGPYTSSWKCDAQRMQVLATVATWVKWISG